jgi:hypothetical protein
MRPNHGGHGAVSSPVGRQGIREMHRKPPRPAGRDGVERRPAALVALHGDDPLGAFQEQRAREAAGARPHLNDGLALQGTCRARDAAGEVEVEDEVLAQALARRQTQLTHHAAERRQAVGARA